MPSKLSRFEIIEKVGLDTGHYIGFSMWAERVQKIYITKDECISSGMYRGYTSGLFSDEYNDLIHKNIELLLPKYFQMIEDKKNGKNIERTDLQTNASNIVSKIQSALPIPYQEWEHQTSTQLKKQLRDPKGYSKEDREIIRAILKKRRKRLKGGR